MSAIISDCGTYRYRLERTLERDMLGSATRGPIAFVMLNPSTADHQVDDPTIRKCSGFAQRWGCDRYAVFNLYAMRSPDPKDLLKHPDPIGPANDDYLRGAVSEFGDFVCAWGASAKPERARQVGELLAGSGGRLWCLGVTKDGHPRHPLYRPYAQPLEVWRPQ